MALTIDIWSDVVCPWCYIGKHRLEAALAEAKVEAEVRYHSFELDPSAPKAREGSAAELLSKKLGRPVPQIEQMWKQMKANAVADGIDFQFATSNLVSTFDCHRLLHLGATLGKQVELKERLFKANFTDGEKIGDREVLVRLAAEVGIDAERARATLFSDEFADAVRNDERDAKNLGITGVPFFVFGQKYAVSGAQPAAVLGKVIAQTVLEQKPDVAAAPSCDDDVCAS